MIDDFRYWVIVDGQLQGWPSAGAVPDEYFDISMTIAEAIGYFQKCGCIGRNIHTTDTIEHRTAIAVLKMAVEIYGQVFPVLYRGDDNPRPDGDYALMYGTRNIDVAAFYGAIQERHNVKGLLTVSTVKSVTASEFDCDEEIIFFPM